MRVLPPEVSLGNPSAAERRVHRLLRDVRMEGYAALHSVGLSEHDYKIVGEIDFLLVGPDGIFILEVKGGRVALREGVWVFTDRYGREHRKSEGPFNQGKSGAFSLIDRLRPMLPKGTLDRVVFGWAAVFPDIEFTETSVEWSVEQVIDCDDAATPAELEAALTRLVNFWWDRFNRRRRMDEATVQRIVSAVRPDFEKLPSLRRRTEDFDERALELTDAQFRYLDATDRNRRVVCDGGAGTGKTFLAVEAARREAAAGRSVTVTSRSPVLAAFIADQAGMDDERIVVSPVSRLAGLRRVAEVLIVDEAQDVMNMDDLADLDGCVVGGLGEGRWRMFLDRNHQAGVLGSFDAAAFELVDDGANACLHLPDNCRNTLDVVAEVVAVTGADVGASIAGGGPPVTWRWWSSAAEGGEQLAEHLRSLLDDGVDPHQITVLTGLDPADDPVLAALPQELRRLVAPLTENTVHRPPRNRIGAARTGLFKGLENSFICVTDVPTLTADMTDQGVAELYVAMTRPRAGLFLGLPTRLHAVVTELGRRARGMKHP